MDHSALNALEEEMEKDARMCPKPLEQSAIAALEAENERLKSALRGKTFPAGTEAVPVAVLEAECKRLRGEGATLAQTWMAERIEKIIEQEGGTVLPPALREIRAVPVED